MDNELDLIINTKILKVLLYIDFIYIPGNYITRQMIETHTGLSKAQVKRIMFVLRDLKLIRLEYNNINHFTINKDSLLVDKIIWRLEELKVFCKEEIDKLREDRI
jgi:hypothetical protein